MATAGSHPAEDQLSCSICLDVFNLPVTLPCGHNFCKRCITQAWEVNGKYQCPLCKDTFYRAPELRVNTVLSEMAAQVKETSQRRASRLEQDQAKAGDVACDVCTDTKLKALKSCLVCLVSYCQTHLEPHHRIPGLMRHQLIDPVDNLEDRMCKMHDRPLEMFCRTDQTCVCKLCMSTDHRRHFIAPLEKESQHRKHELMRNEAANQQKIRERRQKIEQIKQTVKLGKEEADRETAAGVKIFTALLRCVETGLAQLMDQIEQKQKSTEEQAEGLIRELEEEISALEKSSSELEQLSRAEDHLKLVQNLLSLKPAPPTKDWDEVSLPPPSYEGSVSGAVHLLVKTLGQEMKKLCADSEVKRVRQYRVEVSLDPDTAHPALILSSDRKRVSCGDTKQKLPDNPKRFSASPCVLGKQGFSSGRFYYEVQVGQKTRWDLGVARESVNRKGHIAVNPSTGFWVIWLKNGNEYSALDEPSVTLSLKTRPQKVGVFVDYEERLVSFYDVEAGTLIYSFTGCDFSGRLCPFFGPGMADGGRNSAPLIICPVDPNAKKCTSIYT